MRQIFHIFKKDVRHLRMEISFVLTAVAFLSFAVVRLSASLTTAGNTEGAAVSLLSYLVPLTWWTLIARLIYDESLAIEQPFWITRPYSRKSLIIEKALFIVMFVNLPKLIGDSCVLVAYEFHLRSELSGLLWNQLLLTVLFVLPVVALCAVTTGFVQLLIALLLVGLTAAGWSQFTSEFGANAPWIEMEWVRSCCIGLIIATAAMVVITRQYACRDTAVSRFVLASALLLIFLVHMFLPWTAAFSLQSWLSKTSVDVEGIHVELDESLGFGARTVTSKSGDVELQIPLSVTGLAEGLRSKAEGMVVTVDGPDGEVWRSSGPPPTNVRSAGNKVLFRARVDPIFAQRVKNHRVRIRGSVYLTLLGHGRRTTLPVQEQPTLHPTAGVGLCSAVRIEDRISLNCRSFLRTPRDRVTFDVIGPPRFIAGGNAMALRRLSYSSDVSYSPFPGGPELIPVTQSVLTTELVGPVWEVSAMAIGPVAHVRKDFEITELRTINNKSGL